MPEFNEAGYKFSTKPDTGHYSALIPSHAAGDMIEDLTKINPNVLFVADDYGPLDAETARIVLMMSGIRVERVAEVYAVTSL